jgi:nitrogen-specific signal transduction histidine kinase
MTLYYNTYKKSEDEKKKKKYMESRLHFQTTAILTENLHHELNTPLTVIAKKLNRLQERVHKIHSGELDRVDCPIDDSLNDFRTIDASLSIIQDVLDRMKSFKNMKVYESRRTLYEVIKVSCDIVKATNSDEFDYLIDDELKNYKVDAKYMRNGELTGILVNHIKNSIEAHATIIRFRMNSTKLLTGIQKLSLYIADNGNGIPLDRIDDIFEENFTTKQGERGNGLFVNKFIMDNSSSSVDLISSTTRGTIFELTIPFIVSTKEEIERATREVDIISEYEEQLQSKEMIFQQVLDSLPDMVWFKKVNGEYVIANKAIRDGLLFSENPIGKNDIELSNDAKAKFGRENHTFGEKCSNSDVITLERNEPSRFLESGKIKGSMLYLEVNKSVITDKDGNILGVCGSGRDLTEYIEAINSITTQDKEGTYEAALEVFKKYEFGEECS